jgi:hypothetical protein
LLECFAIAGAAQCHAERALRLAGAAAALRRGIGVPLTTAEQAKLEAGLDAARRSLSNAAGASAWLEGWNLPFQSAVEEVLMPDAESPCHESTGLDSADGSRDAAPDQRGI